MTYVEQKNSGPADESHYQAAISIARKAIDTTRETRAKLEQVSQDCIESLNYARITNYIVNNVDGGQVITSSYTH